MKKTIYVQADDNENVSGRTASAPVVSSPNAATDLDLIRFDNLTDTQTEGLIYNGLDKSQGFYDFKLRSITAGNKIAITSTPASIKIDVLEDPNVIPPVAGGINESNTGGLIYKGVDADNFMRFRNILTDQYLTITQTPTSLTLGLANPPTTGDVDGAANLGGSGFSVFKDKTGSTLNFRKVISASNSLLLSYSQTDEAIVIGFNEATVNINNLSGTLPATKVTGLAAVATSGSYTSLSNKPAIPSVLNDLSNVSGTPTPNQFLVYNGTQWTPTTINIPSAQNTFGTISSSGNNILANSPNTTLTMNSSAGIELVIDGAARSITYNLKPSGVTAGTYNFANITVDQFGRITTINSNGTPSYFDDPMTSIGDMIFRNVSNQSSRLPIGTAGQILTVENGRPTWKAPSVSQTVVTAGNGINVNTVGNNATVSLASLGIPAGNYSSPNITVDQYGRITNITAGSVVSQNRIITAGAGLVGGGNLTEDRTIALAVSGAVAGTYTNPTVTVDQFGRVTQVTSGGTGNVTSVGITSSSAEIVASNTPITSSGNINLTLSNTGVTPGAYTNANITVSATGRITNVSSATQFVTNEELVIDSSGGIRLMPYELADIQDASSELNTFNKGAGKMILDMTTPRVLVAIGSTPTSGWITVDGTTTVTPT